MDTMSRITTGDTMFGAHTMAAEARKIEQAKIMTASLNNLANAAMQKNTPMDRLIQHNSALTRSIANMTLAMANLSARAQVTTPAQTWTPTTNTATATTLPAAASFVRPAHWQEQKPAWDKVGYFSTHGYKVRIGHNSTHCLHCGPDHKITATWPNPLGGCEKNKGWPRTPT